MNKSIESRLDRFLGSEAAKLIRRGRTGIEKESLRVTADGHIAATPHPQSLGSALTHPYITTDYSEALLEFITPPFPRLTDTLSFLEQIHQFSCRNIGEELLWCASMPCMVGDESSIPIARYGSSNVGRMKHVYRQGLSYRYGRLMQIISGVHFNYSLPDRFWPVFQEFEGDTRRRREFVSDSYFAMIRNFQRLGWIIPYLFGSSPAVCKSFIKARHQEMAELDAGTLYRPYATSLRMSDIGYKNQNQSDLRVSYDSLRSYVTDLRRVIQTPHPDYEKIGVMVDGEYRQLNSNVLQIENEFYSFIRPKQIARSGEKPTLALKRRGVRYVEVRALDVSPFDPLGVNEEQLRFIEVFLIFCLLLESPPVSSDEQRDINKNQQLIACCGRDPELTLRIDGEAKPIGVLVDRICSNLEGICSLLDSGGDQTAYRDAVRRQRDLARRPDGLPSARILEAMRANNESFFQYAMRMSMSHMEQFKSATLSKKKLKMFEDEAARSLAQQRAIEAADNISFDEYLRRYFAQSLVEREQILGMNGADQGAMPAALGRFGGDAGPAGKARERIIAHGRLARTLAAAKPGGLMLCVEAPELTFWVADGMDITSKLISVVGDEVTCARLSRAVDSDIRVTAHAQHVIAFLGDVRAHRFDLMVFSELDPGVAEMAAAALAPGAILGVFPPESTASSGSAAAALGEQAGLLVGPGPHGAVLAARSHADRSPKRRGGRKGRTAGQT